MNDRIQEIREALEAANNNAEWSHGEDYLILHATDYITYLLSEAERLQMEMEQWKQAAETQKNNNLAILKERRNFKVALSNMAESEDEWYVGRIPMREYARAALSHLKG